MNFLKRVFALILIYTGISWLVRNYISRKRITILVYHDPNPMILYKHINYLSSYYEFINIAKLCDAIYQKRWDLLPKKGLVITFDDGYKGNFNLLRLFNEFNLQPTIYLCSEIVNTHRNFWTKSKIISRAEKENLKKMSNKERLTRLCQKGFYQSQPYRDRQALSLEEIVSMKEKVDFQSHGRYHAILTRCNDKELSDEIILSKKKIQELTKKECCHFSYPNGNFNKIVIRKLKEAGYLTGRSICPGWNKKSTHPFKLKAIGIADDAPLNWLIACLTCIPAYLKFFVEKFSKIPVNYIARR